MGRIRGHYPVYLPRDAEFTEKLVQRVHCETLNGGIGLTMAAVRDRYWVTRVRSLVKIVRKKCYGCKRFQQRAFTPPVAGQFLDDRTTSGTAVEVIGVDFASRGRPRVVYSDNGGAFIKASKWLEQLRKDEKLRGLVEDYDINWKFNLSRAPWWDGQFVKSAMFKVIGGGHRTWDELSEVMLDIEIQINRRPLSYVEDVVELPTLTPASFLHQRTCQLPEEEPWRIDERKLKKRAKYLIECKNNLWRQWKKENLVALRERHNMAHKQAKF